MSHVIIHKPQQNIVISRPSGVYRVEDSLSVWQAFCDTHDLSDGVDVIVDHRQVQDYDISYNQMRTIAAQLGRLLMESAPNARMAHYCPHDLGFGMARMYEQIATAQSDFEVAVFRDADELAQWLGLSQDTIAELTGDVDFLTQTG